MESEIKYRWAEKKDLSAILLLLGDLPKTGVKEYIRNFLVAETDGVIVACMGYEIHKMRFAVLRSLRVQKNFCRQGIATALFAKILEKLSHERILFGVGLTLTEKMEKLAQKFEAVKISHRLAVSHIDRSQPSELLDNKLAERYQAWLFPIQE